VTANESRFARRRLAPRALAALSACCLAALIAGPASATASPSVINASLTDVSCPAATSCVAVGWFLGRIQGTSAYQNFTLAETWNGSTWTIVPSPSPRLPGGGAQLNSVSCTSSTSCMAVGETLTFHEPGGYLIPHPLAESWNGTKWSIAATPKLANSGASLNGVSCTSPSNCMAVGNEGFPKNPNLFTLAEQWNGTAWKFVSTPPPPTPGAITFSSVSCSAATACMAVGFFGFNNGTGTSLTLAEQWNGTSWHRLGTPTPDSSGTLAGVTCTAASACMAVGGHLENGLTLVNGTLSEQWNGTGWKVRQSPNPKGANFAGLDSVWCSGPAACMATGGGASGEGESGFTVAEAWNGTSWSILHSPSPGSFSDELLGVSCTSSSSCLAVGDDQGIGNLVTLSEAWNGTSWSVVKTPRP
jgi:hypothetical protein